MSYAVTVTLGNEPAARADAGGGHFVLPRSVRRAGRPACALEARTIGGVPSGGDEGSALELRGRLWLSGAARSLSTLELRIRLARLELLPSAFSPRALPPLWVRLPKVGNLPCNLGISKCPMRPNIVNGRLSAGTPASVER